MTNNVKPITCSFDASKVQESIAGVTSSFYIEHLASCPSTNTLVAERADKGSPSGLVLVTDQQTQGRGRQGRRWISSPNHSLTFSLLWSFADGQALDGLSLVVGVAIARGLESLGLNGITLKWPNDVLYSGGKLGGVLIEVIHNKSRIDVVIGIGLNLRRDPLWDEIVDQPFSSVEDSSKSLSREDILAAVLSQLNACLDIFTKNGFVALQAEWNARNAFANRWVGAEGECDENYGLCVGASNDGTLELRNCNGQLVYIVAGDVSLRIRPQFPL